MDSQRWAGSGSTATVSANPSNNTESMYVHVYVYPTRPCTTAHHHLSTGPCWSFVHVSTIYSFQGLNNIHLSVMQDFCGGSTLFKNYAPPNCCTMWHTYICTAHTLLCTYVNVIVFYSCLHSVVPTCVHVCLVL